MLLSDSLILQPLEDPNLSEFESGVQKISICQLNVVSDFVDITNKVYETEFEDTNAPSEEEE